MKISKRCGRRRPSRAVLEFDLREDRDQLTLALHGWAWWRVSWDVDQWLRGKLKHGHEFKTADEALQACRDFLHETMSAENVSLDEVS